MNNARRNAIGLWIPLVDFASQSGRSLSTLRRQIKANKITYKIERGRYLLWNDGAMDSRAENADEQTALQKVQADLRKAQEEIAELKTLIALYEETNPLQKIDE